jgi:Na+/melibiose symporter-like transporter
VGTVLAYSGGSFAANVVAAFSNAALPLYLASYGLPNVLIGFVAQERSFVGGLIQPIVGAVSDRTRTPLGRRRPFFLAGVPLVVASLALLATQPPIWAVVVVMAVLAFFLAVAYDPYLALLADIFPSGQRGRVGGGMAVAGMLGQVALLLISSVLWERDQALVFSFVALAVVAGFGITFIGVREPASPLAQPGARLNSGKKSASAYVRALLGERSLARYVGVTTLFWLGTGGVVPFLTRFGIDELGVEPGSAFLLLMVAVAMTALFAVPAGMLGDRLGKKPVLMVGLFGYGAGCVLGAGAQDAMQAFVILAAVGAANAACTVLLLPVLADLIPRSRAGELTGLGSGIWSIAQPLGAAGAGLLADLTGSLRAALLLAGLLTLASAALLTTVRSDESTSR